MLTEAVGRQAALEEAAGPGTALVAISGDEPAETATAAVFGYTAVLARKPGNQAALAEAGRLFGRVAHLLDVVDDLAADRESGAWNPLLATGADVAEARRLCDDALLGIRLALAEAEFADSRLVTALLVDELARSVLRMFADVAGPVAAPGPAGPGIAGVAACAGASTRPWLRHRRFGCCECDCCCASAAQKAAVRAVATRAVTATAVATATATAELRLARLRLFIGRPSFHRRRSPIPDIPGANVPSAMKRHSRMKS